MEDKWTELKLLTEKDIDSCIDVKNEMMERFKKRPYAFDFLYYLNNNRIENLISNKNLYGIFNKKTNELLTFNAIKQLPVLTNDIIDRIKKSKKYSINKILNILKNLKGCYIESFITRLRPNMIGIGKHFVSISNEYIKNNLNYDFRFEVITISNVAMYRLYTNNNDNNNKFSFGCNITTFNAKNINNEIVNIPSIYMITLFNQDAINSLKSIIEVDNRYEKDTISNLANKINNKENILLIEGTKAEVYRVKE